MLKDIIEIMVSAAALVAVGITIFVACYAFGYYVIGPVLFGMH